MKGRKGHGEGFLECERRYSYGFFLEKERMISGQYYNELLDRFEKKFKETWPNLAIKKKLFQHNNAPAHSSRLVAFKLYELLFLPPYSPGLALCDFFLFPKFLAGKNFAQTRKASPRQRCILENSANRICWREGWQK